MSTIDNGGPAFPAEWENNSSVNQVAPDGQFVPARGSVKLQGASLRDYFAVHASEEDIESFIDAVPLGRRVQDKDNKQIQIIHNCRPDNWRQIARYMHADAMLSARKEKS